MPDTRSHRGPHPEDAELFAASQWPRLREAVGELSWLLTRGYSGNSSLKLVGDRHALTGRQREAVARCACADLQRTRRAAAMMAPAALRAKPLLIDGFNLLTTIEAALAGGVILCARDGCRRDMASVHGSYHRVGETRPALEIIGRALAEIGVVSATWYLDRPVSNSGRLRKLILDYADEHGWPWEVTLVPNPDELLAVSVEVVATADSGILDRCGRWINLAGMLISEHIPAACIVDLAPGLNGDATQF